MSRLARVLCSFQGGTFLWLGYCAVQSARNGVTWAAWLFAAASLPPLIAIIREVERAEERRVAAAHAACCARWRTSLATDHDPTCPNQTRRRSSAA